MEQLSASGEELLQLPAFVFLQECRTGLFGGFSEMVGFGKKEMGLS